jgi:hypothetical protein
VGFESQGAAVNKLEVRLLKAFARFARWCFESVLAYKNMRYPDA